MSELAKILEALLLASDQPLSVEQMSRLLSADLSAWILLEKCLVGKTRKLVRCSSNICPFAPARGEDRHPVALTWQGTAVEFPG